MAKKIIVFIVQVLFAFFIGTLTFAFGGMFSSSLNVTCELQNDGTYTCRAHDTLLGVAFSEKQAEHVTGLEQRLKCSGSGSKKGCSHISEFVTATGEKVQLSSLFTSSKSQVTKLVSSINGSMQAKSTPIDYTSDTSPWLIFSVGLSSFLFLTALLKAFLVLFEKNLAT